jgi:hypothetical protein
MRHRVAVLGPVHAVEAEIGDVMLAAGVEAAADLDVQPADGFVEFVAFGQQPRPQFAGQAPR